jgi:molybdate transport system permease protein
MENFVIPLKLSLRVAVVSTVIVVTAGTLLAFLLARTKSLGMEALDVALTLPLVLPPTVTGYLLLILFGVNGYIGRHLFEATGYSIIFTWHGAVLASSVVALPLMVKIARAAFEAVDETLVLASYTMGRSKLYTFFKVVLPLSRKGVYAGAVLSFARALGEFGATLMVAGNIPGKTETMPLAIYSCAASGEWDRAGIMALFFVAVSALFLFITNGLLRGKKWV